MLGIPKALDRPVPIRLLTQAVLEELLAIHRPLQKRVPREDSVLSEDSFPVLHNGQSFTGRGRRPAFELQGPSWPRSSAVFGYMARRLAAHSGHRTRMPSDRTTHPSRCIATA